MGAMSLSFDDRKSRLIQWLRDFAEHRVGPFLYYKAHMSANDVTVVGNCLTVIGAFVWAFQGHWHWAFGIGLGTAIAGRLLDWFDGATARVGDADPQHRYGGSTKFGEALDSITDRFAETAAFSSLAWVLTHSWLGLACIWAISGSLLVSYARAKAELLGVKGSVGLGDSLVRLVLLGSLVLLGRYWWHDYQYAAWAVAGLAWYTVWERLSSIRWQLYEKGTP